MIYTKFLEIENDLPLTVAYLKKVLDEFGVEHERDFPNDSSILVIAKRRVGREIKCIALRADTDGLPMSEFLDLPFKSIMKICMLADYDAHAAMMLGAIFALNQMKR